MRVLTSRTVAIVLAAVLALYALAPVPSLSCGGVVVISATTGWSFFGLTAGGRISGLRAPTRGPYHVCP